MQVSARSPPGLAGAKTTGNVPDQAGWTTAVTTSESPSVPCHKEAGGLQVAHSSPVPSKLTVCFFDWHIID